MITAAQNELLTRVGRATPMGKFIRQFWIPACLSSELVADGPQMRLMLLGSHDPLRLLLLPLRLLLLGSHHSSRWGMSSSNYTTWSVRLLKTCGHLVRR